MNQQNFGGAVIPAMAGFFLFGKRAKVQEIQQEKSQQLSVVVKTEQPSGLTGVTRYLLASPLITSVAKYVKKSEKQHMTGVAKYVLRQTISDRNAPPPTGVAKYLAKVAKQAPARIPDGTLEGTLSLEGKGAVDGRLRGFVSGTRIRDLERACAGLLAVVSDAVEIRECAHGAPDDFDRDMWLRIHYRIPGYAMPVGEGLEFPSPLLKLVKGHYLFFRGASVAWEKERQTDILLYFTQRLDGKETVRLPAGYALREPPQKEKADETYAMFDARVAGGKGVMTVTIEGELRRRQIPASGFPGFKHVMERAGEWSEQVFRVEKGGIR